MEQNESAQLFFCDLPQGGTSDKEYRIQLELVGFKWAVHFQYGRRGQSLKSDAKTKGGPVHYEMAKKLYDKTLREKLAGGYTYHRQDANAPKQTEGSGQEAAPAAPVFINAKIPTGIAPELLLNIEVEEVGGFVVDENYWFQEKRDGHRRLIRKTAEGYQGINKLGQAVPVAAELAAELDTLPVETFILDGELEGDRFIVYDALELNLDIRAIGYGARYETLQQVFEGSDLKLATLLPTWKTESEKMECLSLMQSIRAEGVVIKSTRASYQAGKRAQHMKLKFYKSLTARVSRNHPEGKDSVFVELLENGRWIEVGGVSVPPKYGRLTPGQLVELRYLYFTEGKRLYQPNFLCVRTDVLDAECTIEQAIYKQGVATAA